MTTTMTKEATDLKPIIGHRNLRFESKNATHRIRHRHPGMGQRTLARLICDEAGLEEALSAEMGELGTADFEDMKIMAGTGYATTYSRIRAFDKARLRGDVLAIDRYRFLVPGDVVAIKHTGKQYDRTPGFGKNYWVKSMDESVGNVRQVLRQDDAYGVHLRGESYDFPPQCLMPASPGLLTDKKKNEAKNDG